MTIGNQLVFDINGNVEDFIFILSTKDYRHLGALQNVVSDTVHNSENLSSFNTISFEIYKTVEKEIENENVDIQEPLWDEIDNLKLIYIRELDEYFEIEVQLDDTTDIIKKTIKGTSLCESELGQIKIHGLEVNTETDIDRDDYEPTIFYNPKNSNASLLHRVLSESPHYTIMHVDESLCSLQRTFSVDNVPIYDWLMGDCANEFNCLFQFDTTTRGVYVYDLYTVCKDCGYRGDYIDECPECGSTDLDYFGEDTTIYIDKENLTDAIQFTTDVGSIKNCFKLVADDDVITAMIKLINPYGSNFIYKPTDSQLAEMPEELRNKIISHNELYVSKKDEYEGIIADILEASSKIDYYTHTMMPTIENAEVTAQTEADKLTAMNLSPLGLSSVTTSTSKATVESALKNYARVFVKTGYVKLDINQSNYKYVGIGADGWNHGTWTGNFKVTNYSDEEDVAYSEVITVDVYDNYQDFLEQKIMKNIATNSDEEDSVFDVLSISELDDFKDALELYCLKRLESFYDAIQSALDVLLEADQASESANLYDVLYLPYYEKLQACQSELDARQKTIDEWQNTYDNLLLQKEEIQAELNFEDYLGDDLYKIFCMYRREDTYQNDNYISTGLSNTEIIQKAKDFIEVAEKELEKARTPKHSITSTLYNLLIIPEFKPIIDHFKLGNWLRICVDGELYRLRLIGYKLSFSSIQTLEVTFSNITKVNMPTSTREKLESAVDSMASNFDYFVAQAKKGNEANVEINRWMEIGLDSSLYNVKNNNNEEIVTDKHGIIARTFNDVTGNYEPEQLRITHNIITMTEDNWKTSSLGLGKHNYTYFDGNKFVTGVGYGISSKFSQHSYIYGSQIISGDIYSENYKVDVNGNVTQGSHLALKTGGFSLASGKLVYDPISNKLTVKGLTIEWDTSTTPEISDISGLNDYLEQLDGRIQTYSQATDPSSNWTATEKAQNVGDLWFDTANSLTKRWNGSSWDVVTDSELEELAKSKAQIFTSTPVPPYYVGDLWVQGSSGDIMNCVKTRTSEKYTASDWAKSSKYTDDSALTNFITGEYADDLMKIVNQVDGKARAWYQSEDPSLSWDTTEDHEGDLWYDTDANSQVTSIYQNGAWKATSVPRSLFDTIDGIASIYVTIPDNPVGGDLLIPTNDIGNYKAGKVYKYNGSTWVEISYTDDTKANEALNAANQAQLTANSAKSVAENAETIGNNLVNVLGYDGTKITGTYLYSPVISSGTLLIGDKNGTYAEITTDGVLNCAGANVTGNITSSTINGSEITTKTSGAEGGYIVLKAGNLRMKDEYGVDWLRAYRTYMDFTQPLYDSNNNPLGYTSGSVTRMYTSYHAASLGDDYDYPAYSFNIDTNYPNFGCLKIGYGAVGYISPSNVYFAVNYRGDRGTDICGTARTLDIECGGYLKVVGTKSRVTTTENYNDRLLYCYETPTPMFGDIGEGQIDETGKCYIFLDDIFGETIDTDCVYQVFLQPYGKGECYVTERTSSYFIVEGTGNLSFGWELKAIQKDFDTIRLEENTESEVDNIDVLLYETEDYLDSLLYDVESEEF